MFGQKQKVLIVEDDQFLSKMYYTKFQMEGFEPEVVGDGEEALKKLVVEKPNVILLDIMMPKLDGIETLKRIKQDPNLASIPVLMLTNLSAGERVEEATKLGAAGYLIKSSQTPNEVVAKVKEILSQQNAPQNPPPSTPPSAPVSSV